MRFDYEFPPMRHIAAQNASLWFYPDRADYVALAAAPDAGAQGAVAWADAMPPGKKWSTLQCNESIYCPSLNVADAYFTSKHLPNHRLDVPVVRVVRGRDRTFVFTITRLWCVSHKDDAVLWTVDVDEPVWWTPERSCCLGNTLIVTPYDGRGMYVWVSGVMMCFVMVAGSRVQTPAMRSERQILYSTKSGGVGHVVLQIEDGNATAIFAEPLRDVMRGMRVGVGKTCVVESVQTSEVFTTLTYEIDSTRRFLVYDWINRKTHSYKLNNDVVTGYDSQRDVVTFERAPALDLHETERGRLAKATASLPIELEQMVETAFFARV